MNKMTTEQFEELYRKAWLADVRKAKANRNIAPHDEPDDPQITEVKKPKPKATVKLSEKAKRVNRMIKLRMSMREIGDALGTSHQAVSEMKRRYGLPREDVE